MDKAVYTLAEPPNIPSTNARQPVVICLHGSGDYSHQALWQPLLEQIRQLAPVLFYDRPGTGLNAHLRSRTRSHSEQTPADGIRDLLAILSQTSQDPPYVLLAFSHGGTFAREFLHQHPERVAGMILVETGLAAQTLHDARQNSKRALDSKPLSVVFAGGLPVSKEMNSQRRELSREQLSLSSNARWVELKDCQHNVIRLRPEVVLDEVRWVLEQVEADLPKRSVLDAARACDGSYEDEPKGRSTGLARLGRASDNICATSALLRGEAQARMQANSNQRR